MKCFCESAPPPTCRGMGGLCESAAPPTCRRFQSNGNSNKSGIFNGNSIWPLKKNVLNNMPDFVPLAGGEGSATLLCCGSAVAPSCRGHVSIPFLTCRCNVSQTPLMCKLKLHPKPYPNESAVAPSCRGDGLPTTLRLQVKNTIFLHNFTGVLFN